MPPASEPIRERIMAAILTRLQTITASAPVVYGSKTVDYWTTPSLVTRSLLWLPEYDVPLLAGSPTTQLDGGPVVGVVRSSGSTFERLTHVDPAGTISDGYEHQVRVTLWGFVKGTLSVIASTALERLWRDLIEAMLVDPTLGGVALDSRPDGPLDTDDGAMEPLGWVAQDWLVTA